MNVERIQQPDWERRYVDGDTPWDRGCSSPQLETWLQAGTLAAGPVLVPGCGQGHEVVSLCRRGFEVTAVDLSATALARLAAALERHGVADRARLVNADFLAYAPAHRFAAVYEQTSLCALPPAMWSAYAARLHAALAPGGTLLAMFVQTGRPGGPPWHCDPLAMQRLFRPPYWRWVETGPPLAGDGPVELPCVLISTGV